MDIVIDFTCDVEPCRNIKTRGSSGYCNGHLWLANKYGTPTPTMQCHECGEDYVFISGSSKRGGYSMCPACIDLLKQYGAYVTRGAAKYGVTRVFLINLLVSQNFLCALCPKDLRTTKYCVDHDHQCCPGHSNSCGKCIRGLLCIRCNALTGHYENNDGLFDRIAKYVDERRSR